MKNKFDEKILADNGAKLDTANLQDYHKHLILEEPSQIFEAYLSLTKFLIENLQTPEIEKALKGVGLTKTDLQKN